MDGCEFVAVPFELESAGVDYLTATAYRTKSNERFDALGNDLLQQQRSIGHEVKPWKAGGYHGTRTEGISRGVRHDTYIIRLSSDEASDHWQAVAELASNITRLDVQVTFKLRQPRTSFFKEQHDRAMSHRAGRGRRRNLTLIQSTTDGDSLYLGKRESDIYARVYDKGREQKTDPAGVRVRQELEYKGERAVLVANMLRSSNSIPTESHRLVSTYMEAAGLETTWYDEKRAMAARGRSVSKGLKLGWLGRACKPSIIRLCDAGRLEEVLDALGLRQYIQQSYTKRREESPEED